MATGSTGLARKSLIAAVMAVGVVVGALALWKLRPVIALVFVALTIAAAMRPGVEWLHAKRVPRGIGVVLHYIVLVAVVGVLLWLIVPQAITQVQHAIGGNAAHTELKQA